MPKTFAEIESEITNILAAYEDTSEGIDDPEIMAQFEAQMEATIATLGEAEADKIDGYGQFVSKLEAEETRLATIIKNLSARKKSIVVKIDAVKDHLLFTMEQFGQKKIAGNIFTASIREGKSVDVFSESLLPAQYWRIIPETKEPDKKLIKEALAAGEVPGAAIHTSRNVHIS